ncbi:sporulation integral membrane protein YlbJ [Sporolactobacillus sp. THM7-7]|nr:sporulation integral membrane protein YlbJ [Sporolactobacillus sp. THM7-7]
MNRSKTMTYTLAASSVGIAALMVKYPQTAVEASLQGLQIWWHDVFPALFPFFVLSELMIGFGVVTFAGMLFEPIMRPVFRVPGLGGFVFMMGLISGFPAGARITAKLYREKKLTKTEAERLASFTNFSNPLFLFGVTAIGFFKQPALGLLFALAHYVGNIGVGLAMRFYRPDEIRGPSERPSFPVFTKALKSMHEERLTRNQPLGKILGDAVVSSVGTLLAIGGFIALFSMLTRLLAQIRLTEALGIAFNFFFERLGFSPALGSAVVPGIFELTIGAHEVGEASAPMMEKVIVVSSLLGFCGFSIQAQTISILAQSGLSTKPFLIGRLLHAFFSGIAAFILYHFMRIHEKLVPEPTFAAGHALPASSADFSAGSLFTLSTLIIFIFILIRRLRREVRSMKK